MKNVNTKICARCLNFSNPDLGLFVLIFHCKAIYIDFPTQAILVIILAFLVEQTVEFWFEEKILVNATG